jgi:N-acetylglutamate synthase-like GNAT family acetyltransferase
MFDRSLYTEGNLALRPMQHNDVRQVLEIIAEFDEDDAAEAQQTYEQSLQDQYCLTDNNEVIGVCGFKSIPDTDRTYALSWTYLASNHRHRGKGSRMLRWLLDLLHSYNARKLFVSTSDYRDPEDGDIYRSAREAYAEVGFKEELRHRDFYAPGESMISLGLRLQDRMSQANEKSDLAIRLTDVDEIPETDGSYWLAWDQVDISEGTKPQDFRKVIDQVAGWGARHLYMSIPSDIPSATSLMSSSGFKTAGRLIDYFEDGVDEVHYRYDVS